MTYSKRKRLNKNDLCNYQVIVTDWYLRVYFNEYADINLFDLDEFEERFYMLLEGRVKSTTSKKLKENMFAQVVIHPGEFWYDSTRIREDVHNIGSMVIQKEDEYIYNEDTILFRVTVPTKSYENIRAYLTYKGKASIKLLGSDLYYRKGDIYYIEFKRDKPF